VLGFTDPAGSDEDDPDRRAVSMLRDRIIVPLCERFCHMPDAETARKTFAFWTKDRCAVSLLYACICRLATAYMQSEQSGV
jgi:hypothetical protein